MAGTLKEVELTVACGYGDVGRRFTPNGTVRQWLLDRKWAVIVDETDTPARPAKLAARAAKKLADGLKKTADGATSLFT
jgi:hypothetical protein